MCYTSTTGETWAKQGLPSSVGSAGSVFRALTMATAVGRLFTAGDGSLMLRYVGTGLLGGVVPQRVLMKVGAGGKFSVVSSKSEFQLVGALTELDLS